MISWDNIETVLLDMDGTLLDLHFDYYFWSEHVPEALRKLKGYDDQRLAEEYFHYLERHQGTMKWYCLDYWSEKLGLSMLSLKEEIAHLIQLRPFVLQFFSFLNKNQIPFYLVTNAHPDSIDLKLKTIGLSSSFAGVFHSHTYQLPKESVDFWHKLSQDLSFNPEKTLFIDDNLQVLASAKEFGVKNCLTVLQPNLNQAPHTVEEFHGITHFDELINHVETLS